MFSTIFWILAIWFVCNVIYMWFALDNQTLQKTFAWINVAAIIIGFWVYYAVAHNPANIADWFIAMNWLNIAVAIIQFYFGYKKIDNTNHKTTPTKKAA